MRRATLIAMVRPTLAMIAALALVACGGGDDFESSPVDVSGSYTVGVTNKSNGCGLQNWEEGKQSSGIGVTMQQDGSQITGTIDGVTGALVSLWLGASTFQGSVAGNQVEATNFGTKSFSLLACTYTINMVMDAVVTGDALQGTLSYTPQTNGSPDCGVLDSCQSVQEFSGSRPPK